MAAFDGVPSSLQSCIITDIQLGRVIGGGAHGRILEAKWEGFVVAVKQHDPCHFGGGQRAGVCNVEKQVFDGM